jgi:hypothetical protein
MMGPSQSQLRLLSPEDRIQYKKWLRGGLLIYGSLMAALVFATVASHIFTPVSSDVAGEPLHTAAMASKK